MKLELQIIINKIEVSEYSYTIEYSCTLNGKTRRGVYEGSYDGWSQKEMESKLKKGEALAGIFRDIADNYKA